MNIVIWHVHGSWMTAFVQGNHRYLLPTVEGRGPDGRGRARTWEWPDNAVEVSPDELACSHVDAVIVQRPRDLELARTWLGPDRLGASVPVIWLEHNMPQGKIGELLHPAAECSAVERVVHVTHTNDLFWDCGEVPTSVIEHGIVDPGHRWTGELGSMVVAINEPLRRHRVTGTDLLERFGTRAPIDLFGLGASAMASPTRPWLTVHDDVPQATLHREMARRRVYVHPFRWTSLGLSLLEAMYLGMPVVALATGDTYRAVPPGCGVISNDVEALVSCAARLTWDTEWGTELGRSGRSHVSERYDLERFLSDWNRVLEVHAR